MSTKDLIEDLNHLRIKYGSGNLYRTLMKLLREEYEELSSLFGTTPSHPSATFYPTSPQDYYAEFMEVAAQAAHDTLEQHPVPLTSFYDEDTPSIEAQSINNETYSLDIEDTDDMTLIDQIFNNPYSAPPEISPTGEPADTPQETPLKIIQTCGAGAASEEAPKKKLLKKKAATESVEVIKESPTKGKKGKSP